jgi:hypothetical protein
MLTHDERAALTRAGLTIDGRRLLRNGREVATICPASFMGATTVKQGGRTWLSIRRADGTYRSAVLRFAEQAR